MVLRPLPEIIRSVADTYCSLSSTDCFPRITRDPPELSRQHPGFATEQKPAQFPALSAKLPSKIPRCYTAKTTSLVSCHDSRPDSNLS
jgi:hypothetical protein